jgi:threonine dehydrogenase-like Zn-dependent dehydrogenase
MYKGFRLGDRVTFWGGGDFGGFAEYRAIQHGPREFFRSDDGLWYDKSQAVIRLNDAVSYEEGAVLEVLCSAMRTIHASGLVAADKVAVLGLGAGGLMLLQAAKALGANVVIGIDLENFRSKKAEELGADAVFNNSMVDNAAIKKDVWNRFGELDIVFDALGNDLSREKSARNLGLELLRPEGKYALYGMPSEDQRINMALINSKGIQTVSATFDARYFSMEKSRDLLHVSQRLVVNGLVKIKPLITHHVTLEQTEEGLRLFKERKHEVIKIVIDVIP